MSHSVYKIFTNVPCNETSHSKSQNGQNVCFSSFDEFHERCFHSGKSCMEKKAARQAAKAWPKGTDDGAFKAVPRVCLRPVLIRRTNNRRRPSDHERFVAVANDQFLAGNTCNCIAFHRSIAWSLKKGKWMPLGVLGEVMS